MILVYLSCFWYLSSQKNIFQFLQSPIQSIFYSMIKKLRLSEVSVPTESPFKRKQAKANIYHENDENAFPYSENLSAEAKFILGKNIRPYKSFGQNTKGEEPLKLIKPPCIKNPQTFVSPFSEVSNEMKTIEVDDLPQKSKIDIDKKIQDKKINTDKRARFFSAEDKVSRKNQEKSGRKRFFSGFDQEYPSENSNNEQKASSFTSKPRNQKPIKNKKRFLQNRLQVPKNFQSFQQYLQINCLNLQSAIKSKLKTYRSLRQNKSLTQSGEALKIFQ